MISLGIDTSEKYLFVALFEDQRLLAETKYEAWQRQSEYLVEEIASLFQKTGIEKRSINAVICSKGPGSYTGVRIGLTVAKTIAFALKIPLFLVSSLELLQSGKGICACLSNARSKRSYFGVYENGKCILEDRILTNEEVRAYLAEHPEVRSCGDLAYLGLESTPYEPENIYPLCLDEEHRCPDAFAAAPVYLKDEYGTTNLHAVVRAALPYDLKPIGEIWKKAFPSSYSDKALDYEFNENPFAHIYAAVLDGEVVGFIDFMITFSSCVINYIAIKDEYQRKGIGNLLLGQLLKDCQAQKDEDVEYVTLEVRTSNEKAIAFYKKHKFEIITTKKAYYDDGEDAYYMVRSLPHD